MPRHKPFLLISFIVFFLSFFFPFLFPCLLIKVTLHWKLLVFAACLRWLQRTMFREIVRVKASTLELFARENLFNLPTLVTTSYFLLLLCDSSIRLEIIWKLQGKLHLQSFTGNFKIHYVFDRSYVVLFNFWKTYGFFQIYSLVRTLKNIPCHDILNNIKRLHGKNIVSQFLLTFMPKQKYFNSNMSTNIINMF